jgi:sialidase-1
MKNMRKVIYPLLLILVMSSCTKVASEEPGTTATVVDTAFDICLFRPGDYGSANWRIPALLCLKDGSLLAVCDKRKYNETDLPEDIDIVSRRSTDGGHTWSEPVTIAEGTGYKHGYGDAALVQCENGDVVCVFVGGNGLWASTENDPIRSYVCRSTDGGHTWSQPEDITAQLWGSQAANATCHNYKASFFGSGNGLRLTRGANKGRIMFAAAMCRKNINTLDNFVVYSDDNGHTWSVSNRAYTGGDEAKLMELTDGRILISVRQSGPRGFNYSSDDGLTWGTQGRWEELTTNACNGDILRVKATDHGDSCNLLLHSLPNSMQREDVSLFFSYDEGVTWQNPMLLFNGPSVYSSITLMPTGGIGVLLEQNPNGACELWFKYLPSSTLSH